MNTVAGGTVYGTVVQGRTITLATPAAAPLALSGLPPVTQAFTGRDGETSTILTSLAGSDPVLITGLAGIGKTELALHTAQQAAQRGICRGGVLFIDLFGYDERRCVSPERALDGLLRALGIPAEHIPADLQSRRRLYQSTLSALGEQEQRVLVVIDNAAATEQVKNLLPPRRTGAALLTSRHALGGLDARILRLEVLPTAGSVDLIRRTLSVARGQADPRVDEEPASAAEVADLCGNLPLALRISASLLADQPVRTLASLADELRDTRNRLDELARDDVSIRAALDLSYRRLDKEHSHLLRLAALNPGPDFSVELVSHMSQKPRPQVRRGLEALGRAHLVEPGRVYGRWKMHDLVRLYAEEKHRQHTEQDDRSAAIGRMVTFFMHLTTQAISVTNPEAVTADNDRFDSVRSALEWLDEERENVTAATLLALRHGDGRGITLSCALAPHLARRRRLEDLEYMARCAALLVTRKDFRWEDRFQAGNTFGHALVAIGQYREASAVLSAAAAVARRNSGHREELSALMGIGTSQLRTEKTHEAEQTFRTIVRTARRLGDRGSEGVGLDGLAITARDLGRPERGIELHQAAISIFREHGDAQALATALLNLGIALHEAGDLEESIHALKESFRLFKDVGADHSSARAMGVLGCAYKNAGRHSEAVSAAREAAASFEAHDDLDNESIALHDLAHSLCQVGEFDQAVETFYRAVRVARQRKDFHNENIHLVNLGNILRALGRTDEAITARRECVAALPADADPRHEAVALINLGQLLFDANRVAEGQSLITNAAATLAALHKETGTPFRLEGLALDGSGRLSCITIGSSDQEGADSEDGNGERLVQQVGPARTAVRKPDHAGHTGDHDAQEHLET
ncbi:tetratricopeptide repeat protein [Streptomyces rimosus]|uniref:tetratricopeptide repeat protein n=1 Tax=Streptomyces rimosus TaxID=1927 RepID=UPI00379450F9